MSEIHSDAQSFPVIITQPQTNTGGNYKLGSMQTSISSPTGLGYPQGLRGWSSGICGCGDDTSSCM